MASYMQPTAPEGYHILINERAGTVLQLGQEAIAEIIKTAEVPVASLQFVEPDNFLQTINSVLSESKLPVLLGGGDGTIMRCAPIFLEHGRAFGIIPMGTMNLLARDLNIPVDLPGAFAAYASGSQSMHIDVGMVNDHLFLCCAAFGMMPAATSFREANRDQSKLLLLPRIVMYVFKQLNLINRRHLTLRLPNRKVRMRTASLIVSNNQFCMGTGQADGFKKESLCEGVLGIYNATPHRVWDRLRLLMRLGLGTWRHDPVVSEMSAKEFVVETRRSHETLSLDGENIRLSTPIRFWMRRQSLGVLVPDQAAIVDAPVTTDSVSAVLTAAPHHNASTSVH